MSDATSERARREQDEYENVWAIALTMAARDKTVAVGIFQAIMNSKSLDKIACAIEEGLEQQSTESYHTSESLNNIANAHKEMFGHSDISNDRETPFERLIDHLEVQANAIRCISETMQPAE